MRNTKRALRDSKITKLAWRASKELKGELIEEPNEELEEGYKEKPKEAAEGWEMLLLLPQPGQHENSL